MVSLSPFRCTDLRGGLGGYVWYQSMTPLKKGRCWPAEAEGAIMRQLYALSRLQRRGRLMFRKTTSTCSTISLTRFSKWGRRCASDWKRRGQALSTGRFSAAIDETLFAMLYSDQPSRPNAAVNVLVRSRDPQGGVWMVGRRAVRSSSVQLAGTLRLGPAGHERDAL